MKNMLLERLFEVQAGLSTNAFSKKIGISQPLLVAYKAGKSAPSYQNILKICSACGVSADWLLGLSDKKSLVESENGENTECALLEERLKSANEKIAMLEQENERLRNREDALLLAIQTLGEGKIKGSKGGGSRNSWQING